MPRSRFERLRRTTMMRPRPGISPLKRQSWSKRNEHWSERRCYVRQLVYRIARKSQITEPCEGPAHPLATVRSDSTETADKRARSSRSATHSDKVDCEIQLHCL